MRIKKPESRRTVRPFGSAGFTLVELLVVISIIMLLATMLMPTVQVILRRFYAGRSAIMIRRLHDGALLYKEKTRFLPGEKKDTKVPGGGATGDVRLAMSSLSITGSQVLAACLFNIEYDELGLDFSDPEVAKDKIEASKVFVTFKPEYLTDHFGTKMNSISDGFPKDKAMAICYFLASNNPTYANKVGQFRATDNLAYLDNVTGTPEEKQTALEQWVDEKAQTVRHIVNNGSFLLIAPGLNRKYIEIEYSDPNNSAQMLRKPDTDDIANDYGRRSE